jgi:hypothetical protein
MASHQARRRRFDASDYKRTHPKRRQKTEAEREAERAKREAERARLANYQNDNQVLTFGQWCLLNNFSASTGRRIIGRGGVGVTQLSQRRIGITIGSNRAYQQSRVRGEV